MFSNLLPAQQIEFSSQRDYRILFLPHNSDSWTKINTALYSNKTGNYPPTRFRVYIGNKKCRRAPNPYKLRSFDGSTLAPIYDPIKACSAFCVNFHHV